MTVFLARGSLEEVEVELDEDALLEVVERVSLDDRPSVLILGDFVFGPLEGRELEPETVDGPSVVVDEVAGFIGL